MLSSELNIYIPLPFPRLRNHCREGGKIFRTRGSAWLWGNSVCWTQQGRLHSRAHSSCDSMHRTCTISSHTTMPTWRGEGKAISNWQLLRKDQPCSTQRPHTREYMGSTNQTQCLKKWGRSVGRIGNYGWSGRHWRRWWMWSKYTARNSQLILNIEKLYINRILHVLKIK